MSTTKNNDELMNTTLDLSKCILDETFKHWHEAETDDIELVKEIKRVIQGAQNYYQKHNDDEKEITVISNVLRQYAENKYMETWEKDWEDEINDDNEKEIKLISNVLIQYAENQYLETWEK